MRLKRQGPGHWPGLSRPTTRITSRIDLARLPRKGVRVLEGYARRPDRFGVLERIELALPAFRRGCWFAADWPSRWPAGANRALPWPFGERLGRLSYGALFALFELRRGGCLAIVPIAGPLTLTWLNAASDGRLVLNLGALGTTPVACNARPPRPVALAQARHHLEIEARRLQGEAPHAGAVSICGADR